MHIPRNAPLTLLSTVVCHWPLSLSRLLTSSNLFWLVYFVFVYSVPVNQWQVFNVCYSMMSNWAVWTPAPCSCFGKKKMSQLSNVWASMGNPLNVSRACRHSSYYPFVILFWHLFVKTDYPESPFICKDPVLCVVSTTHRKLFCILQIRHALFLC